MWIPSAFSRLRQRTTRYSLFGQLQYFMGRRRRRSQSCLYSQWRTTGQPISDRSKENGRRWRPRCSYFDWRSSASWDATVPHSKLRHRLRCRYATARNARLALSSQYPCRELCNAAASGWRTPPSAPATSPKQALVLFARISPRGSCAVAATTSAIPTRLLITAPSKALRDSTSIIACLA